MTVNFHDVRQQIKNMGENAPIREKELNSRRAQALAILTSYENEAASLQKKIQEALQFDHTLRCAIPDQTPLTQSIAITVSQQPVTVIAADGSQINYSRHSEVQYALINYGAIIARSDSPSAPRIFNQSELFYGDRLYTPRGMISEIDIASSRDLGERHFLASLVKNAAPPIIALTDGPLELWGPRDGSDVQAAEYQNKLSQYKDILLHLESQGVTPGGYVDNPGANLVVRLLELAIASPKEMADIRNYRPLRGVTDSHLFKQFLQPGARSTIFYIQSLSSTAYQKQLRMAFFYINVGLAGKPWLARVEIPDWVVQNSAALDDLHAALINQCRILRDHAYPYYLHRAHEIAVVTMQEKEQVDLMVAQELRQRGVELEGPSHKQFHKNSPGRARYK
ncbi:MAG: DNA double-strand break repair nuclease NurA [Anaerolineales bacterium]|nr:DNA double-strand break repair nuclease NurA [Anaerolineales bacterium]